MKQRVKKQEERDKAFIGAAIGAVAGIAGGVISGRKKRKAEKEALRQQQIQQNKEETFETAQAMSSSYANQDYTDDYTKKVSLRMGGEKGSTAYGDRFEGRPGMRKKRTSTRKKSKLGAEGIGEIIKGVGVAGSAAVNTAYGNPQSGTTDLSGLANASRTQQNKDIARQIQLEKEQGVKQPIVDINNENAGKKFAQSTTARYGTKRDKKFIGGIGAAAGGVGSVIGSFIGGSKPKQLVKGNGVAMSAPKTGLVSNDYEVNQETTGINDDANTKKPIYSDRLNALRCGGKKPMKRRK